MRSRSVSPLSSVLMRSSYNFGENILCLRVHMPQVFVECSQSNGGALLLAGTTVVGSGGFCWILLGWWGFLNVSLIHNWCDVWFDNFYEVFCEIRYVLIRLFSVDFNCVCMMMNFSSYLIFIVFPNFVILNLELWRPAFHK